MLSSSTISLPAPPAGYRPAIRFEYPKLALQLAAVAVLIAFTPLLLWLARLLQGGANIGFVSGPGDLALVVITIVVTVLVHELIHGLVYQLLGYRVSYGVSLKLIAAYAGAFAQWQRRDHNIVVALAPLLVLNLALLPLLASSSPTLLLIGFTALLFNTGGAVGDVYLAGRLLRLPRATLLYDADTQTMLLYLPQGAAA